jgi:hypothetical protein
MSLDNTFVGIPSNTVESGLQEVPVFVVDNPYDADELVWLTQDIEKAELIIRQLATPYKARRKVYIVEPTDDLIERFQAMEINEFKRVNIRKSKPYTDRNAGLTFIDKVVILKS